MSKKIETLVDEILYRSQRIDDDYNDLTPSAHKLMNKAIVKLCQEIKEELRDQALEAKNEFVYDRPRSPHRFSDFI